MKDESLSAVLEDIVVPPGMELCNTQTFPGYSQHSMILNIQVCTVKPVLKRPLEKKTQNWFSRPIMA